MVQMEDFIMKMIYTFLNSLQFKIIIGMLLGVFIFGVVLWYQEKKGTKRRKKEVVEIVK